MKFLELAGVRDPDLSMAGDKGVTAIVKAGLDPSHLAIARWMFSGVRTLDPEGTIYLLHTKAGKPRFRVCPVCLWDRECKYYPVHWRFRCWVWCPIHDCALLGLCPHCRNEITLPVTMLSAGRDGQGIATLDRCLRCSQNMAMPTHSVAHPIQESLFHDWELLCVRNGRAVASALLHRSFRVNGEPDSWPVYKLSPALSSGVFPANQALFSGQSFSERLEERKLKGFRPNGCG